MDNEIFKAMQVVAALLFGVGCGNIGAWGVWDKMHMPVMGIAACAAGAVLYLCCEMGRD